MSRDPNVDPSLIAVPNNAGASFLLLPPSLHSPLPDWMFCLSIIKDKIPIHPQHFSISPEESITAELNKKYANRVLHDVGLCVCVFDLSEVGEGKVRYGDGFLWYQGALCRYVASDSLLIVCLGFTVTFRMVVFRPFESEVVIARVKSSDEDGIRRTSASGCHTRIVSSRRYQ